MTHPDPESQPLPLPGAHCHNQATLPPVLPEQAGALDPLASAIIDHLVAIQEHQAGIAAHQDQIDCALAVLYCLVEGEVIP